MPISAQQFMSKKQSNYFKNWEIYVSQCGSHSRLNITELSNLFQQTAALHSASWGMSYFDMQKNHQAWVLSSMRIELEKLPGWHETVQIETWIESLKGMRSIRDFELQFQGKTVARASSLWVVLNTEKRRPEPLAIAYDDLEQFPERKATKIPAGRIDLTKPAQKIDTKTIFFSDLDIVGHVNNVKYMEWCLDTLPKEWLEENKLQNIDLNYIKEVHYQDEVAICKYQENDYIYFYVKRNNIICFAMRIELKR